MKCWVCGAIYDDQSWSGRCEDCASAVDSGIETIGLDGLPIITDGYDLPLGDYDGQHGATQYQFVLTAATSTVK